MPPSGNQCFEKLYIEDADFALAQNGPQSSFYPDTGGSFFESTPKGFRSERSPVQSWISPLEVH